MSDFLWKLLEMMAEDKIRECENQLEEMEELEEIQDKETLLRVYSDVKSELLVIVNLLDSFLVDIDDLDRSVAASLLVVAYSCAAICSGNEEWYEELGNEVNEEFSAQYEEIKKITICCDNVSKEFDEDWSFDEGLKKEFDRFCLKIHNIYEETEYEDDVDEIEQLERVQAAARDLKKKIGKTIKMINNVMEEL